MIRNGVATLFLAYGAQKIAWAILDQSGLNKYGPNAGWPYDLNPIGEGIAGAAAIIAAAFVFEKKVTFITVLGVPLAIGAAVSWWIERTPSNPYKDYGEDNFAHMLLNLVIVAGAIAGAAVIQKLLFARPRKTTTEQNKEAV